MSRSPYAQTRVLNETRVDQPPSTTGSSQACLVFIAGDRIGRKLDLSPGELSVGRDPTSGVMISSDLVSRNHARFTTRDDETILADLGSTNGTYVNDQRITERHLVDGDRIAIGRIVMKYLAAGNTEASFHDELYRLVSYDGLTDVYNKRYFEEHLSNLTTEGHGLVSLIVFDADHFKSVNDTHGHAAGDSVLRQIADCARRSLVEGADLARVGGEEFAVLASGKSLEETRTLAETIRRTVEEHTFTFGDLTIPVTVSLGVATLEADSKESGDDLFKRADEQLYKAKQSGRNRVCA